MKPLRLANALFDGIGVQMSIDGCPCIVGSKYLLIERCLTVELPQCDYDGHDHLVSSGQLVSHPNLVALTSPSRRSSITDNPVLVALAYQAWWSMNGKEYLKPDKVHIPSTREAETILRKRQILSPFSLRFQGLLAGECERELAERL